MPDVVTMMIANLQALATGPDSPETQRTQA
jgi:hypothetical protein